VIRSALRTTLVSGAAVGLMATAGACSCSVGSKSNAVSKDDVASQISAKMTDPAGLKPESVTCPNDLAAKVGAQLDCTMKSNGQSYAVNVTVTSVNGSDVKFDMVQKIDKAQIANDISAKLTDGAGNKPDSVSCPDNLLAKVGAQLNCTMNAKNQTYNVNVTVTSVSGTSVKYDMVETVDKDKVAGVISNKVTPLLGVTPDSVTCPDNLKGVEGATLRCQVNTAGKTYGATVTVTNVDAGDVSFDILLDNQPS
ncbi:Mycobacterium numidiamassiliense ORFan, partial [Mycobacterium numidiamassiliense]|jgi:hypothetical protein